MLLSKVIYSAFRLNIFCLCIEPTTFRTANTMLTTEPQEHITSPGNNRFLLVLTMIIALDN